LLDRVAYRNTSQKLFGGIQNNIKYKNFELDFLLQFVKREGLPYLFSIRQPGFFDGILDLGNEPTSVLKRWQKPGDIAFNQRYSTNVNLYITSHTNKLAAVDASFMRCTNLSLSWQLPIDWCKRIELQNGRLFVNAQNLFTVTNFQGMNPETDISTSLPPLRIITVGVQFDF
jgi:hypothetical protein